jgi:Membrane protein implicated in regulation of membrane protease activity
MGGLMMNSIYWIIVLAILIFIEILTLGITTIWFAGGAVAAFILSLYYDNLVLEIIVFLTVSLALLYFTRPVVMRQLSTSKLNTEYTGVIGMTATVVSEVDNMKGTGQVDVEGQTWSAISLDGNILMKDARVKVQGISGTKVIVSQIYEG